jgi:UDP-N-acetylmuramoyl-L-alanyl-D-glutamate--2,6-diaminopimelate ligase
MILGEALKQISGIDSTGKLDVEISGISYDSRLAQPGDLFVAIKGEKIDGARFIAQAAEKGAVAIASEQKCVPEPKTTELVVPDARRFLAEISRIFYQDPSTKLNLVAITGTKGKTTTSYLMDSIYRHAGLRACLVGTIGMKIGDQYFYSSHTTPESSIVMHFLHKAVSEGCTHGAMEVSSIALALKRVFGAKFSVGVFMNLTHDHLDFHKDMEAYFQAKQLLFSEKSGNRIEASVINTDDSYGQRLAKETNTRILRFGFNKPADLCVRSFENSTDGTDLVLDTPAGEAHIHSQLIGRPNIYNMMAAVGAAICQGFDLKSIQNGIEALKGVPGRMERVDAGQDFAVIVDYAHTPDSLENILKTAAQLPHKKLITIFGCGGDRDRAKRPMMGEIAARLSDWVIATSDNPRSEDPIDILNEIEPGLGTGSTPYQIVPDRRQAIEAAIAMARTGDVVLIAGKGHEDYQIIGNQKFPFDDRKVASGLIRKHMESEKS